MYCVLGCDMVHCNFPGHCKMLQNCFCMFISDSADVSIRLYVVFSLKLLTV